MSTPTTFDNAMRAVIARLDDVNDQIDAQQGTRKPSRARRFVVEVILPALLFVSFAVFAYVITHTHVYPYAPADHAFGYQLELPAGHNIDVTFGLRGRSVSIAWDVEG